MVREIGEAERERERENRYLTIVLVVCRIRVWHRLTVGHAIDSTRFPLLYRFKTSMPSPTPNLKQLFYMRVDSVAPLFNVRAGALDETALFC